MSDERPRPQFGEYATREEQLARIHAPSPEQLNPTPDPAAQRPAHAHADAPRSPMVDANAMAASRNQFNLVGTVAFLVYGLIEVVITTPTFLQMNLLVNDQLAALAKSLNLSDVAAFPPSTLATTAGYALVAVWIVLWVGAALLSWHRIRAQKLTLWVPFVAGVLANLIAGGVIVALMFSDPTIAAQLVAAVASSTQ